MEMYINSCFITVEIETINYFKKTMKSFQPQQSLYMLRNTFSNTSTPNAPNILVESIRLLSLGSRIIRSDVLKRLLPMSFIHLSSSEQQNATNLSKSRWCDIKWGQKQHILYNGSGCRLRWHIIVIKFMV